jgi:AraC-like DNA-binding protein
MRPQPLTVAERSYLDAPFFHVHSYYQVVFPRWGQLHMQIEGRQGAVGPQRWAVLPPGMGHLCWSQGENRFLVLDVAAAVVDAARAQLDLGAPAAAPAVYLPLDDRPAALASLLRSELADGGAAEGLVVETLGGYVGALLARALAPAPRPAPRPSTLVARQARDYLDAHALRPLRIAEVAAAVGASESHLQRSFRACFGVSVLGYIQQLRLRAARQLLSSTAMPIHAVAAAVGFESQSYLTRLFTREVGISPARYRAAGATGEE